MPIPTSSAWNKEPSENDNFSLPDPDDVMSSFENKPERKTKPSSPAPSKPVSKKSDPEEDDGWRVDPKTGKRYKQLRMSSKEAIAASKKNKNSGLTLEQARQLIAEEEDFDADDLNSAANTFLAHLRVPPSKDELEKLRQERIKKMRKQSSEYKNVQENLSDKYGDEDLANG